MHILDFILYFPCIMFLWYLIGLLSDNEFTEELGAIAGMLIVIIFTIAYIIVFGINPDWNWVDIFQEGINIHITW